ncbi:ATP-binding protein [Hydrogenophaga sp.]|uniref:ATP-binding protein n=1 Tax=Hydrogenophaga sp. TaxID=1904254 RepID=UPI003F7010E8
MKLQYKAWLLVVSTIGVLTLASVLVSRHSITASFEELERDQFKVEGERAGRLLNQQLQGLSATLMDYAYWTDTVEFAKGSKPDYFSENFGTDNLKYLGIDHVLVLDVLGRPIAGAELTEDPSLQPVSESISQMVRSLAVSVLSDRTSQTVMRTYRRMDGNLYLVSIAAVRSQFEPGSAPHGALAMVRRFDAKELARFSDILMHPVRLSFTDAAPASLAGGVLPVDHTRTESRAPVLDHEGRPVAFLVLELERHLHQAGRSLALVAALQVALAGLVVGTLLVLLLNHLVLRRLQRVHVELSEVTRAGIDSDGKLSVGGDDELADLARGINRLLDRNREDAAQQRQAHERQEALHLQLAQSQKTEALGRFTSGIAHDFNNSLAAISGWVRLAQEDLATGHPSASSLEQALKSIQHGSGLMKQLLAFSRQSTPRLERLRLSAIIDEARTLVGFGLMGRCTLEVDCRIEDDWIEADSTQMKQVIVNLLINACDAMDGKGAISLVLESKESTELASGAGCAMLGQLPRGRYITLSVSDEGPGIAPEHLDRIFDPFFTTKAIGKGTGLGLSVVHGIMARHSGGVGVSSTPGQGACFTLVMPAKGEAVWNLRTHGFAVTQGPKKRLLYAEDDALVRDAWSALLERQGWVVTRTRDGEEAWEHFQSEGGKWDAVLTDLSMPKLNGLQLARRIASTNSPPPVVLMSGQISAEDGAELGEAGFRAVLHKPVDQEDLLRVLSEAVA